MGHLRITAYYFKMVGFIFKQIAEIYYHRYGLIIIFVRLDKDFLISSKMRVKKKDFFGLKILLRVIWYIHRILWDSIVIS